MNKVVVQLMIEKERNTLRNLLEKGQITEGDIILLMAQDLDYCMKLSDKNCTGKDLYLKNLYKKPYLLCDQNISDSIKKLLPYFMNKIYESELKILNSRLKNRDYTVEEYNEKYTMLHYSMYESSLDGQSIERCGRVEGINEFVLK